MKIQARTILILTMGLSLIASTAIGIFMKDGTKSELTSSYVDYYRAIGEYENKDRELIEKYIHFYITYRGCVIPQDKLEFIKSMTDEDLYESKVRHNFINTVDNFFEEKELKVVPKEDEGYSTIDGDIEGGVIVESDECDELEYQDFGKESGDFLAEAFYIFKDDLYIAKIGTPEGKLYTLYFKIRDGKVADIYA